MTWGLTARVVFVAAVAYFALVLRPFGAMTAANLGFGALIAGSIIFIEDRLTRTPLQNVVGAVIGGLAGLLVARLTGDAPFWANAANPRMVFLHTLLLLVLPYIGVVLGAKAGEGLHPERLVSLFRPRPDQKHRYRILDTSVIIDGRIADICETGFVDGTLVVPQFVLKELQQVADSADSLRRARGRRGLDILQRIQKMAGLDVIVSDADFPEVEEVDLKLIELARSLAGKIVTNDFHPEQGGPAARRSTCSTSTSSPTP